MVGLGGSGTNDGGAGLLAALGATADAPLTAGPARAARASTTVDLAPARARLGGVALVAATDVDNPLPGLFGATKTYGPQKGLAEERLPTVDAALEALAAAIDRRTALEPGAGAAGGLGFALLRSAPPGGPGIDLVADAVGLRGASPRADLVVTGEGAFDFSSRSGKVPYGVAEIAGDGGAAVHRAGRPGAGRVAGDARARRGVGVLPGRPGRARSGPSPSPPTALAELAERVARTWSRG